MVTARVGSVLLVREFRRCRSLAVDPIGPKSACCKINARVSPSRSTVERTPLRYRASTHDRVILGCLMIELDIHITVFCSDTNTSAQDLSFSHSVYKICIKRLEFFMSRQDSLRWTFLESRFTTHNREAVLEMVRKRHEPNEGKLSKAGCFAPVRLRLFRGRNKFRAGARAHAVDIPFTLPMSFELQGSVQLEGEIGAPGNVREGTRLASGQTPLRYRRRRLVNAIRRTWFELCRLPLVRS